MRSMAQKFGFEEWRGGIVRVGDVCRSELRSDMVIGSNPALAPVLRVPVACGELHPGVCRTRDHEHFDDIMALSNTIDTAVLGLPICSFLAFVTHRHKSC